MAKDLQRALDIAEVAELPLTLTATAKESLDRARVAGFSDADFACLGVHAHSPGADNDHGVPPGCTSAA
jgi:3-hydroxyisobutyrate dehydrogenase-like beta-hydroxyacid dehydrogenase